MAKISLGAGGGMCGISAGSICWFESGHSDSMAFYHPKQWRYINVRGLGFIHGIHCPHYNSQTLGIPRKKHFQQLIQRTGATRIALDNNCAIEFINDQYRVIISKPSARAFLVYKKKGILISVRIYPSDLQRPIKGLYAGEGEY